MRVIIASLILYVIGAGLLIKGQSLINNRHVRPYEPALVKGLHLQNWGLGFAGVGFASAIIAGILYPKLRCPSCRQNTLKRWTHHCSECGSDKIVQPAFLGTQFVPRCTACNAEAVRTRAGRDYKVRFCPHCGVHLHTEGV